MANAPREARDREARLDTRPLPSLACKGRPAAPGTRI